MAYQEKPRGGDADFERRAAWKYVGYPGFSRFMASSNDCLALRKFTGLNVRVLLKLQNTVVELERQLDEMDNFTMDLPPGEGGCASFRLDANSPREKLLDEIDAALDKYNSRLVNFLQIHERPVPSVEQLRNIQTWLTNYPNAIEGPEQEFVAREKDLFAVQTPRHTLFGKWMESLGLYKFAGFRGVGSRASGKYYDRNAWKDLGGFWLMLCLLGMLLGPLWALPFILDRAVRLSVVTAFAVVFSMIVIIGTTFKAAHRGVLVAGYFTQLVLVLGLSPAWQSRLEGQNPSASSSTSTTIFSTATISGYAQTNNSTFTAATDIPRSEPSRASTITVTLSGNAASGPTITQSASAQVSSGTHLTDGAIIGIAIGVSMACVSLVTMAFLCYRVHRAKSARRRFTVVDGSLESPTALPEMDDRDSRRRGMSQSAPEIRLFPADEPAVTYPSNHLSPRPDGSIDSPTTADTSGTPYELRVTTDSDNFTFGSVKGKGKSRRINSETPMSAATTLVSSSASPVATSHWERPFLAQTNHDSMRTTLRPDSAL